MSPRSIRRAAEHKARKLAVKQERASQSRIDSDRPVAGSEQEECTLLGRHSGQAPDRPSTPERRLVAACEQPSPRPNLSTGPRTPEGKAISSLNALRTGLTGRTVLLPYDDADAYAAHIEQYRSEFSPAGIRETELVQSLADTSWRLRRIPGLEQAIYTQGRSEFADFFEDHHPSLRANMIELQTHLKYEKQLRNLQLQESRLTRRYTSELKELRALQSKREDAENSELGSGSPGIGKDSGLVSNSPNVPAPGSVPPGDALAAPVQFEFSTSLPSLPGAAATAQNIASSRPLNPSIL